MSEHSKEREDLVQQYRDMHDLCRNNRVWVTYKDAEASSPVPENVKSPVINACLIEVHNIHNDQICFLVSLYNKDEKFVRVIRLTKDKIIVKRDPKMTVVDHSSRKRD